MQDLMHLDIKVIGPNKFFSKYLKIPQQSVSRPFSSSDSYLKLTVSVHSIL